MHEFSLYSQIPATRHGQVLQILAGVTASQPTSTLEQTLIYQQARLTETGTSKKASAGRQNAVPASRLSYHKLVRDLKGSDGEKGPWTFRAEDVPLPGMPNFVSRATTEHVLGEAELENFRQGNGWYKYINQYLASPGHRFVHYNIVVRISRILSVPEGTGALEPLDAPTPVLSDCKPIDPSGTYHFEACVRVEDGGNSKIVEQATAELMAFKKQVEGAVDLRVPERLAFDTRVKGT
ncbi:hypothetical protein B0A54_01286 [Friedmanniomyces endolithicus]|uniref:Mediator of RNA polymerase II transcription subunit 18 n=1 Tax=Friedmanniomyces endolithicus TaxID=329885 RepID=A0A4V5NBU7_9PEZI|nr:hypothetical protein LTS09_004678 [Friedmanniomyces endolithicus]KAK0313557.1 hypothetical protein LTR01_001813 [Friedmanniomyces endolithicus]KAK0830347.1 hypothetical protein LTR73_003625 [Friedmanniomyces endolithicus]TKA49209.1 hypothetical protein B0A54_01286 [Friedmanniomyces endolithicus]